MRIIKFMDEHIYSLASELQQSLVNSELLLRFSKLEKDLNDSYEVYLLSNEKDKCLDNYTRLKDSLGESHKDTVNALKALQQAKEKLNNFPLVKEYLSVYSQVRDLYLEIDNILFASFRKDKPQCR